MSEETSFVEDIGKEQEQTRAQEEEEEEDPSTEEDSMLTKLLADIENLGEEEEEETLSLDNEELESDVDSLVQRARTNYVSERKREQGLIRKNRQITAEFLQEVLSSDKVEAPLFRALDGPYSKRLLEGVRNVEFGHREQVGPGMESIVKKQLLRFRYYGKPVSVSLKGKINQRAIAINRGILDDVKKATEEYKAKLRSVPEKKFGVPIMPKEQEHIKMNVLSDLNRRIETGEKELEEKSALRVITTNLGGTQDTGEGPSGVTVFSEKEKNEMVSALNDDRNVDYDRLKKGDDLELQRFNTKLESYRNNIEFFRSKAITEKDPNKKHAYVLAKNLNVLKLSESEVKAGKMPNTGSEDLRGLTETDKEKIIEDIKKTLEKYSENSVYSTRAKVWRFFKKYPGAITSGVLGVGSIAFAMFAYFQSGLGSAASDMKKFGKSVENISNKANELGDKITEASKKESVIEEGVKSIKKGYDSLKYYTGKIYKFLAFVLSVLVGIIYFVSNALLFLSNNVLALIALLISIIYYYSK